MPWIPSRKTPVMLAYIPAPAGSYGNLWNIDIHNTRCMALRDGTVFSSPVHSCTEQNAPKNWPWPRPYTPDYEDDKAFAVFQRTAGLVGALGSKRTVVRLLFLGLFKVIFFIFPMGNPPFGKSIVDICYFFGYPESANPSI